MKYRFVTSILVLLLLSTVNGWGQSEQETKEKKEKSELKWSFSERFRMVTWDNAISLDDQAGGGSTFTRHRTSLMAQWLPEQNLEFGIKLTNEFRYYFVPEDHDFTLDEIIFDQMYVKWTNRSRFPGVLTVGRQDITLGEGFVMFDGGPFDGSRARYFNALRYDWQTNPTNRLTLFYCYQDDVEDWLPVINDQETQMIEQPEEGLGFYYQTDIDNVNLHAYYMRKNIKATFRDTLASNINTFGARVAVPMTEQLAFVAEGAHQVGSHGDFDRIAFGGYFHFDYQTARQKPCPQFLSWGMIYLSGDDPTSEDNEGWDPIFARWPKWSESYIYTQIPESGVAHWTNMASFHGEARWDLNHNTSFFLHYHHLLALERRDALEEGKTRGDLLIGLAEYKLNVRWSGHFLWELFSPGDYYESNADGYSWVRLEFMYKI